VGVIRSLFQNRNGKGYSLLHQAVEARNVELVQMLSQEALRGVQSNLGETALHTSLRVLLETEHGSDTLHRVFWPTPAHTPSEATGADRSRAAKVREHIVCALVAQGLSEEECTQADMFGVTALHLASALGTPCTTLRARSPR
jgi:hypothetical protein